MDPITRQELLALLQAGTVQLIEALPPDSYAAEHLPGARNAPGPIDAELAARLAPDRQNVVVVYCSGPYCNRSKSTAEAFARLGYHDVRVYTGGKQDWAEAGLAFEGRRTHPADGTAGKEGHHAA
ncbi:rhodanese-like domain-containing protein [Actinomadura sp. SCN-SB]|uniref:rhodanese-like domain-containing protein n=1 Tax=Actinomadura sp. SCN-SB TaxID=3373092 RepID=UPI00375243A8